MYNVKIWKNTGYNGINIPDIPERLGAASETLPALDTITDINLDHVKVHGHVSDFFDVDYLQIGNVYYKMLEPPTAINADTTYIPLTCDGVLTAGGMDEIIFTDGIVKRASVGHDDIGEYCIEDELLAPSEPLELHVNAIKMNSDVGPIENPSYVLVESTIDLGLMACMDGSVIYDDDNNNSVVVPHSYPKMGQKTTYRLSDDASETVVHDGIDTGTTLFAQSELINEGIQKCRALGIESAIFNQVAIPQDFVHLISGEELVTSDFIKYVDELGHETYRRDLLGRYNGFGSESSQGGNATTVRYIAYIIGQTLGVETGFAFDYSNSVQNKRVLYGGNNKIGILTNAGNRMESNPEDLIGGGYTTARVVCKADPHPNGGPYYRFAYINGAPATDRHFWYNCVAGLPWKKVPLIFSEKSGSALNTVNYENSRRIADYNYESSWSGGRGAKIVNSLGDFVDKYGGYIRGGIENTVAGVAGGATMMTAAGYGSAVAAGATAASAVIAPAAPIIAGAALAGGAALDNIDRTRQKYLNEKLKESSAYMINNSISSPTVQVQYDQQAFRDFYGEILFAYRYRPSDFDLARMDKLLTMYGYKICKPISDVGWYDRVKFDYMEADVAVGGTHPMWLKDIIKDQLSAGVRIWHKKPEASDLAYTSNPIVS